MKRWNNHKGLLPHPLLLSSTVFLEVGWGVCPQSWIYLTHKLYSDNLSGSNTWCDTWRHLYKKVHCISVDNQSSYSLFFCRKKKLLSARQTWNRWEGKRSVAWPFGFMDIKKQHPHHLLQSSPSYNRHSLIPYWQASPGRVPSQTSFFLFQWHAVRFFGKNGSFRCGNMKREL